MSRSPHPLRRCGPARALVPAVGLLAVVLAGCGSGDAGSVVPSTTEASTTASPSTTEPTTTAPPTTAPPTTAPPTTLPPPPVSVVVAGDSVGFTIAEGAPAEIPGVNSVQGEANPGCGLLTSGERPPAAVAAGAPADYEACAVGNADADARTLAAQPDVVLLVLGAWERPDHERDGRTVGPDDPAWTEQMRAVLAGRVDALVAEGARVALWVDPCAPEADMRSRQAWFRDEVIAPVAADQPAAEAIEPARVLCVDDRPRTDVEGIGDPRPEDGQHLSADGAAWLWTTWLGPTLAIVGAG